MVVVGVGVGGREVKDLSCPRNLNLDCSKVMRSLRKPDTRERERQTDRQRDRQTDAQTDRQTGRGREDSQAIHIRTQREKRVHEHISTARILYSLS